MKIAIHHAKNSFSEKWIQYCKENQVDFKIVDCYHNDIINQLQDCEGLMWHFHQANPKDVLFAKQLIYSLQTAGIKVFPDFHTVWHFDDKVGQKYLLEATGAPLVPSYVFYDKEEALKWVNESDFPKVFKLRRGAGSAHVKLVKNRRDAKKLVKKAFGGGFDQYDALSNLKERWRKYKNEKTDIKNVLKGIIRLGITTEFSKIIGKEKGYIYFQDFIPKNDFDIRIIVIDQKAFGIKRMVREDDFRASGSGKVLFERHHFDEDTIRLSFEAADTLKSQCLAIDFVYNDNTPLIVEISYGFIKEVYYNCQGYWDRELNWQERSFDAQGWMVETVRKEIQKRNRRTDAGQN